MCVGLLVEEEVSVSKIFRREKGVSFVRSFVSDCNVVETGCQVCLADIGEPGEMYSHSLQIVTKLFGSWNQKS